MMKQAFDERYAASQLARRDNGLRARVRQYWLDRILRHVQGPTVDIGCGAGQLLEQLPAGSIGLEVNPVLVSQLQSTHLDVRLAVADDASISLAALRPGSIRAAVLSLGLEHFDDAASVLRRLMNDCAALGISRLVVVVPGLVGYRSDPTHRTFVTLGYLRSRGLLDGAGFAIAHRSFFPGDVEWLGRLFIYHELMIVYDLSRQDDRHPS